MQIIVHMTKTKIFAPRLVGLWCLTPRYLHLNLTCRMLCSN